MLHNDFRDAAQTGACYSPGNMMWASDVPANITQEPFASRTSGSPTSFPVLFGTAINECLTAVASLLPQNLYHMDPTSDMMRVPSFAAAATAPAIYARSLAPAPPIAGRFP